MKRAIIRISIITILLLFSSSCVDYSAEKSEKAYWSSSSPLYKIIYNKEDGTFSSDYPNVLFVKKKADKENFTILNLTDLHLYSTENKSIISAKKKMANTIDELIKTTEPDLITFTGDFGDNSVAASALRFFADTIEKYDIPWAVVFGNHDCESLIFQYKAKLLESYEHCLFRCGPYNLGKIERDGKTTDIPLLGNYIINIVEENSSAAGYELLNSLIFMNTGCEKNYSASEIESYGSNPLKTYPSNYGCLTATQLQWYEWAVESAESIDSETKTKLFVHIPIFGYATAMNEALKCSYDLFINPDSFYSFCYKIPYLNSLKEETWNSGFENSFGVLHDSEIGCSIYDDFVLEKILNLKSTDMVLCGHDHTNNFVLNYNGVKLVYSVKTGETSYYGSGFTGGTKITIDKDKITTVSHVFWR